MTIGKIKITKAQADAIEEYLECGDVVEMLEVHAGIRADKNNNWVIKFETLNRLSMADLARALLIGYEIEPEYKIGDWVVFTGDPEIHCVGKLEAVHRNSVDTDYVSTNGHKQTFHVTCIRHATPEEIKAEKERRVWAKIGREANDWKNGDVVIVENSTRKIDSHPTLGNIKAAKADYLNGYITGFYPVESFVGFEEVDPE